VSDYKFAGQLIKTQKQDGTPAYQWKRRGVYSTKHTYTPGDEGSRLAARRKAMLDGARSQAELHCRKDHHVRKKFHKLKIWEEEGKNDKKGE